MIVKIKEIIENPEKFKQCKFCLNPVRLDDDSCNTCGSNYFVPNKDKDFTNLSKELDLNLEIEI